MRRITIPAAASSSRVRSISRSASAIRPRARRSSTARCSSRSVSSRRRAAPAGVAGGVYQRVAGPDGGIPETLQDPCGHLVRRDVGDRLVHRAEVRRAEVGEAERVEGEVVVHPLVRSGRDGARVAAAGADHGRVERDAPRPQRQRRDPLVARLARALPRDDLPEPQVRGQQLVADALDTVARGGDEHPRRQRELDIDRGEDRPGERDAPADPELCENGVDPPLDRRLDGALQPGPVAAAPVGEGEVASDRLVRSRIGTQRGARRAEHLLGRVVTSHLR